MSVTSKPWYKRPVLLALAVIGGLLAVALAYFIGQTIYFMVLIKMGKMKPPADTRFEQLRLSVAVALEKRLADPQMKKIEEGVNPTMGNPDAKVRIVEFVDYECTYCRQTESVITDYMARHATDTYLVIRDFPVAERYVFAEASTLAARCVFEIDPAKYWPFRDRLFATQGENRSLEGFVQEAKALGLDTNKFADCYRSQKWLDEINASVDLGDSLGIQGTPTFYFNGSSFEGAMDKDFFEIVTDEARKKAATK